VVPCGAAIGGKFFRAACLSPNTDSSVFCVIQSIVGLLRGTAPAAVLGLLSGGCQLTARPQKQTAPEPSDCPGACGSLPTRTLPPIGGRRPTSHQGAGYWPPYWSASPAGVRALTGRAANPH
jgi:hypothetical protein